ncbi:CaiB/BaiF CoA transferase family protein [Pseudonocardia lacus]|uniref:CaiB/BaiF CoA transferase family protein n=1 Tax=Pseudonocardia lacus TaxID=2835865 RepID=UPI001BDD115A|nr:CoA transferase [Pseudonocardia lacus]
MAVLDGIRVVDLGRFIAGPYCAALLADLGADVIRVERVGGGEDRWVAPVTEDGVGATFLQCNRGKRCLTLDVVAPRGRAVVERLVRTADVVVANLPPKTLTTMGLDHASLKAIKPDIILTTVNAFGSGGDWSNKVGFDGLAQAASGNMHLTGPEGSPSRAWVPYVDFSTAALAALSTLAALMHRERTGEGQLVEAALLRTALTWNSGTLIEEAMLGLDRVTSHNRGQTAGPVDVHRSRDGWVMCFVVGRSQFARWATMIGRPDLVDDDRFTDDLARGENGAALSAYMGAWCADRTTEQCLSEMERHKVPGGPVLSPRQVLDLPHVDQIGVFEPVEYPTAATPVPLARFPTVLSASPGVIRGRAPQLGEHTDEVLAELGYGVDEVSALREARIV